MKRMLVGVDHSDVSQHALEWAAEVCDRAGLALCAARVFEPTQSELGPDLDADLHVQQRQELEEWCRRLSLTTPPEAVLLDGGTHDALLAAAHELSADVLVVGHDRAEFPHPEGGSTAHFLTQHTTVPLA